MKELEFKEYRVGDFVVNKWRIDYSEDALTEMPDTDMAKDIKKAMKEAGYIPYITVSDAVGACKMTYRVDSAMYQFLDTVEHDENGITEPFFMDFIANLFLMASVVGDAELIAAKFKMMMDYGKRVIEAGEKDGNGTATKED